MNQKQYQFDVRNSADISEITHAIDCLEANRVQESQQIRCAIQELKSENIFSRTTFSLKEQP